MKRFVCLCAALFLMLSGCGGRQGQSLPGAEAEFFYMAAEATDLTENMAICSETRNVGNLTLPDLLSTYFSGPESETLRSPFLAGTEVLSLTEGEDFLTLTMSRQFFALQGVDMTIAACCLTNTICAYTGQKQVVLVDDTAKNQMTFKPEDYLLLCDYSQDTGTAFTLYFPNQEHRYLCPEIREATLSENEEPIDYVLRQLMAGPLDQELLPVFPKNTTLLNASAVDGLCTVDLSGSFYESVPDSDHEAYTNLYGIVNSLSSLEGVSSVRFLREGKPVNRYGIFSLEEPLVPEAGAIGPIRPGSGELDVNVYVLSQEGDPFPVPVRVKQTVSRPSAEAVARAAIALDPPQGFYNPIPFGTELLNVSVSGSVCYVDVSQRFIPSEDTPENETAAVWSLVSTLTGLDTIASVVLTIEGESSGLSFVDISEPLSKISLLD